MKKTVLAVLLLVISLVSLALSSCGGDEVTVLNVYNWGEYISDGSEDSLDVNAAFEEYCASELGIQVRVNYTTYSSNEDMYAKLKSGASGYDIVIPSEYMIARMINEGMLAKLDFSNIPNYEYIAPEFRGQFYDPNEEYSVPYTYGMVGIIYNTANVDEEDLVGWELMWNEKYAGSILQFNNSRDAFGTAMYKLGIDVNTTDLTEWERARAELSSQKPLVQAYVMDEIYNKMESGAADIAAYYAGDYITMYESNEDLGFFYPENTNVFVDAMCVPVSASNKELAEIYINFMLSEEIAIANAEYIYYASPNTLVSQNEDYIEYMTDIHEDAMEILYPESYQAEYYENLPDDTLRSVSELWEELKIENSTEHTTAYVICAAMLALLAAFFIYRAIIKKIRNNY